MLDERISHICRPIMANGRLCSAQSIEPFFGRSATVQTIYFLLAVTATSAAIFALMMRADKRRGALLDSGSSDPGVSSGSDGWTTSWFGSNHFGPSTDLFSSSDGGSGWSGGDGGGGGGGGGVGSND
jgi:hypothetical protein